MNSQANRSETISTEEIVDEIMPLLREHFVAACRKRGESIEIRFLGGQKFRVCIVALPRAAKAVAQ